MGTGCRGVRFRGLTAAASLKLHHARAALKNLREFPRSHSRGLIEARRSWRATAAKAAKRLRARFMNSVECIARSKGRRGLDSCPRW